MPDIDSAALAQSIDTTWGRSSTPKTASYSVKMSLLGADRVMISYAAIVTFGTEREMITMKRAYAMEAAAIVEATVKRIKANYKELTGETLSIKPVDGGAIDALEVVSMNCHTASRRAYFRRKAVYEIG